LTIDLPDELERFIRTLVHQGHFVSEADAVAEAVRLLRRELGHSTGPTPAATPSPDPLLGAFRDAADELDAVVAGAMRDREQQPWRLVPNE
jgi:Arc/MetJ-type ribon-helix-helix transcriptional regulator